MKPLIVLTVLVLAAMAAARFTSVGVAGPTTEPAETSYAMSMDARVARLENRVVTLEQMVSRLKSNINTFERNRTVTPRLIEK